MTRRSRTTIRSTPRPQPGPGATVGAVRLRLVVTGVAGLAALGLSGCGADSAATSAHHGPTSSTSTTSATAAPTRLDVVADEFGWDGIPEQLPAGTYPLTFRNVGAEHHEVVVFRNPDRIPLYDLLEAGPAGVDDMIDVVAKVIAGPGGTGEPIEVDLEPGSYEVVCFFPTPIDGRAHFEHGMHRRLEVMPS